MGFLDKRREAKEQREADAAQAAATAAAADWRAVEDQIREYLEEARNPEGATDVALMLKKGEEAFLVIAGAALIEPRRLPGQWQGRSSGYSFHIAKGVNYRIGSSRGTYKQGDEVPQPIDSGMLTITNQRVVFQGTKASREWMFGKLLGVQHVDLEGPTCWSALQVSNRQKVSGFLYTDAAASLIQFRLALAIAAFNGDTATLTKQLEEQLAEHRESRPASLPVAGA